MVPLTLHFRRVHHGHHDLTVLIDTCVLSVHPAGTGLFFRTTVGVEEVLPLPLRSSQILLLSSGALRSFLVQDWHLIGLYHSKKNGLMGESSQASWLPQWSEVRMVTEEQEVGEGKT